MPSSTESNVPTPPNDESVVHQSQESADVPANPPTPPSPSNAPPPAYNDPYYPPPGYQTVKLPTYEEAERSKGKYPSFSQYPDPPPPPPPHPHGPTVLPIPGDDMEDDDLGGPGSRSAILETIGEGDALLGNDFVFFTAFVTAFLFNWIGFLLLMCFCHTIAARYGALSGFGLSLTKWTLIVKRSTEISANTENAWLWWLIMAFGMLICIRAIIQYLQIKRSWANLENAARERLFFFY